MATFSLVIPLWSGTQKLADMALALCQQVRPMCDELILCEDSGNDSQPLRDIADQYLWHRWNLGDVRNLTLGIYMASGDYVGVLNSDITIHKGSLRDLCIPGRVGCPRRLRSPGGSDFVDFCFVADMNLLRNEIGYPVSSRNVGPDWAWSLKLEANTVLVPEVEASHIGGESYSEKRHQAMLDYWETKRTTDREIDPGRHKERMLGDAAYRELWTVESS